VRTAARLVKARRDGIRRNEPDVDVRHAFGLGVAWKAANPRSVRDACVSLIAGSRSHSDTYSGQYVAPVVGQLQSLVKQLDALVDADIASGAAESADENKGAVYHVAVEMVFDRFAGAVDALYADDEGNRVRLLKLIPRSQEQRAPAEAQPPVQSAPTPAPAPAPAAQKAG
jgi:hypothetical protein